MWVIYSTIIWVVYSLYCFVALRNASQRNFEDVVLLTAPVIACPVGIYYIRQLLRRIFAWLQNRVDTQLQTLRAEQKLKLDELKNKTAYYSTQSLIDRYDEGQRRERSQQHPTPTATKQHIASQQKQQHQQQLLTTKPPTLDVRAPGNVPPPPPPPPPSAAATAAPVTPRRQPQWYDRVLDAMVGDTGPVTKYALICNYCFAHNGLVLPGEIDFIQYICPNCRKFNSSRKSRQLHPDGPVVPPSPAPSLTPGPLASKDANNEGGEEDWAERHKQGKDEQEEYESDEETIASRVRRRHKHEHKEEHE
ncbi:hypothetical protein BDB00DRAFT_771274 [Zychaea mexicana]|uniref:uncharacterized protein n=1 Tax=Zychaea mexicana TaxID=64656 RepID=UPI0022FEAE4B|nr:uncharacterized protein BDB00DRAFT_771274 [Zychaea mexicana]KAI9489172.1 hypothetical protein BDB00DRAFT_771274 [Zychaea mexicana]